jgi:FAD/FMN-containing dehydrogenase
MAVAAAALSALAGGLHGSLVRPGDPEYTSVRKPFAGRFDDALPTAVVRCATAEDVVASLAFARTHDMPFALRSGGHSFADWSSTRGLLIDLGPLDTVRLDGHDATVGPGVRLGVLAGRLAAADRTVPCGWCPGVGAAGAVLGGGYGVLGRLYGLGADHLLAAQVALADGGLVWCDAERDPDLFWALRGAGGGLFGAVTALVLMTRPVVPATVFMCRWSYRHAAAVVAAWLRLAPSAPDEINAELVLTATEQPDEQPYVTVFGAAVGGAAAFLDAFRPPPDDAATRELAGRDAACHHEYPGEAEGVIISGPPPDARPGLQANKSEFFDATLPADTVGALVAHFAADRVRGESRDLEFIPWGGAHGRVPADATAFAHRGARFMLKHAVQVGYLATDERRWAAHRWVTASWAITRPHGSGGVYPNYPDPALPPWDRAYHATNLDRLRAVKARYDPADLFRPGAGLDEGDAVRGPR